jgi:hypothetical protein
MKSREMGFGKEDDLDMCGSIPESLKGKTPTKSSPISRPKKDISYPCGLPGFENSWYSEFSRLRNLHDDKLWVEVKKGVDADGDGDLAIFLMDSGETMVELVEDFCWGMRSRDEETGTCIAGQRKVWLDDRSSGLDLEGSGNVRKHENPLPAAGLRQALKEQRFNHKDLPDAARRLIFIADLDPACIHALAATASCHQAPVLRNAIYKHLAFHTSIAVKVPSAGFLIFQLDLHLPYFLLKKSTPPERFEGKVNTKPCRRWIDASFLKLDTSEPRDRQPGEVWGIHEAHISCVVTGSDDWRWVAYGFASAETDDCSAGFFSEDDLERDHIAARELEANAPIWRPRDYWLKVFEVRIEQVREAWEYLIYKVELGVYQYVCSYT